jgi:hypothetical protein
MRYRSFCREWIVCGIDAHDHGIGLSGSIDIVNGPFHAYYSAMNPGTYYVTEVAWYTTDGSIVLRVVHGW